MPNNISNHAKVTTADKQVVRNLEAFGQHPQNASQRTAGAQKVADIRAAAGFSVGTDGTIEAITQLAANRFGGLEKLDVRRTAAALKAGTELGLPNATARQGDDLYVIARAALLPGSSPEQVKARFHQIDDTLKGSVHSKSDVAALTLQVPETAKYVADIARATKGTDDVGALINLAHISDRKMLDEKFHSTYNGGRYGEATRRDLGRVPRTRAGIGG